MGVDRTSYLLYGFKVEDEETMDFIDGEHYDDLMEEKPYSLMFNNSKSDQTIIFDGMCGNYIYIGLKLAELDEYEDDITVEIDKDKINNLENKLKEAMTSWPNYLSDLFKDKEPKLYFFVHAY